MDENSDVSKCQVSALSKDKEKDIHFDVTDLQHRVARLELVVFAGTPAKANKLARINDLSGRNEKVSISMIRAEFRVASQCYLRDLLQQAAKHYGLAFHKGSKGQESFVAKFKQSDKVEAAFFETYNFLLTQPLGATTTESAIARKFELDATQLQSVISRLSRCGEFSIVLPDSKKGFNTVGGRRVKRVR